jgi:hypothetical protein
MYSQIHEVGVFFGGSNYIGDVGPTTYIANEPTFGLLYKWNKSPRHAYRHTPSQKSRQMILILKNPVEVKEAIILKIV